MIKKIVCSFAFLASIFGCSKADKIDAASFDLSKAVGLDVRTAGELVANPAPGSLHVSMDDLEKMLESKIQDKEAPVAVFCESGGRAGRAKAFLISKGYKNVKNIGSWRDWNKLKNL